jgi:Tfp pilus assembly protein FimT
MKQWNNNYSQRLASKRGERGISIVELLIVVVMVGVVTAFAVMQIAGANRTMRLSNSAREFMGYLEKARVDSVRRHAMSNLEMASVTIASANSYTVTIDQNGDGSLDPPRTITIPTTHGATFANINIPTTIRYNWRGRPVDGIGNSLDLAFVLRDASNNVNSINVTSAGDMSLGNNPTTSTVTVTGVSPTANIKGKTYGP